MTGQTFSSKLGDATAPRFQWVRNETDALYTLDARDMNLSPASEIAETTLALARPRTADPEKDCHSVAPRDDPFHRGMPLGSAPEQDAVEATFPERGPTLWIAAQAEAARAVREVDFRTA